MRSRVLSRHFLLGELLNVPSFSIVSILSIFLMDLRTVWKW